MIKLNKRILKGVGFRFEKGAKDFNQEWIWGNPEEEELVLFRPSKREAEDTEYQAGQWYAYSTGSGLDEQEVDDLTDLVAAIYCFAVQVGCRRGKQYKMESIANKIVKLLDGDSPDED